MRRGIRRGGTAVAAPARPADDSLEERDAGLLGVLDRGFRRAAERAGEWLACGPGCDACCHGPFPITRLDVWRLRRGIDRLRGERPDRAECVARRASEALRRLADGYPGDARTGRLDGDARRLDAFFRRHEALPCPALDPVHGRCELYAHRPVSCRTYGPPVRFDGEDAAPCRLCFRGAPAEAVERCRLEPDPDGIEQRALRALGVAPGGDWETLIAFALVP